MKPIRPSLGSVQCLQSQLLVTPSIAALTPLDSFDEDEMRRRRRKKRKKRKRLDVVLAAAVPVALVVMDPSMGLLTPHRRGASDMSDAFAEVARRSMTCLGSSGDYDAA